VKSKSKNLRGVETPEQNIYKDIALDTAGNIFVLGGSYSKNKSCDIYVLTSDGELAETLSLPEPSHCIYIDRRNYLYARGSMGACLKKYKILYQ
jgi:hypothetical protein